MGTIPERIQRLQEEVLLHELGVASVSVATMRDRKVVLSIASALICATGALWLGRHIYCYGIWTKQTEIDLNSGRIRETLAILGMSCLQHAKDTPFSARVAEVGLQRSPARWHPATRVEVGTHFGVARTCYRLGEAIGYCNLIAESTSRMGSPPAKAEACYQLIMRAFERLGEQDIAGLKELAAIEGAKDVLLFPEAKQSDADKE